MIDVALAIDAEAISVQHKRDAAGTYTTGGKFVAGAPTTTSIRAVVQPASGRSLMDMPEGIRAEAKYLVWSRTSLIIDDRIVYGADTFRIIFVWPRPVDGFYRAAMGKT